MTKEELIEIANKFIKDKTTCMSYNFADIDLNTYDENKLKSAVKEEFQRILGICGCGESHLVFEGIYNLLNLMDNKSAWNDDLTNKKPEEYEEYVKAYEDLVGIGEGMTTDWKMLMILYMLDDRDFIEHGTSIYWGWPTELGKDFLKVFDDKQFDWEEWY